MRTSLIALSAAAALVLSGCVSYPGLTNTQQNNGSNAADVAGATSGSSAGGSNSGAVGPQQPGGGTSTSQPATVTGTVQSLPCSKVIIVQSSDTDQRTVFQSTSDAADFAEWQADDNVSFDA